MWPRGTTESNYGQLLSERRDDSTNNGITQPELKGFPDTHTGPDWFGSLGLVGFPSWVMTDTHSHVSASFIIIIIIVSFLLACLHSSTPSRARYSLPPFSFSLLPFLLARHLRRQARIAQRETA